MVSYIDPNNSDRSVIRYNLNNRRTADMYEHKTYGIWNLMIQKKIDKDSRIYFGIDNLFNHRDDDRASPPPIVAFVILGPYISQL